MAAFVPENDVTTVAIDENAIADHLELFLEAEDNKDSCKVFTAVLGGIHVYCFPPSVLLKRNYWTVVTMGMSGTKMQVPDHFSDGHRLSRCELMCYLPADWTLPIFLGGAVTEQSWPFEMLRSMGMYVANTKNWLADCHGLPSLLEQTLPGSPFIAGSKLSHCILLEPVGEDPEFGQVHLPNGEVVNIYLVVPLTAAEAQWKRDVGAADSIFFMVGSKAEGGENVAVDYVIDTMRPCAVDDMGFRARMEGHGGRGVIVDEDFGVLRTPASAKNSKKKKKEKKEKKQFVLFGSL